MGGGERPLLVEAQVMWGTPGEPGFGGEKKHQLTAVEEEGAKKKKKTKVGFDNS